MKLGIVGILLAGNAALAVALTLLWSDAERVRWKEPAAIAPSLDDVTSLPAIEPIDVSRYRETIARPLFAQSRRAVPRLAVSAAEQPPIDPLKDLRILGMYGTATGGGVLVRKDGKVQRVPFGGKIGEWTVAGEEGRNVALVRNGDERRQLPLALNNATSGPPQQEVRSGAEPTASTSAPATGAARAAAAQGRPGARGGSIDVEARQQRIREIAERINARRATRGLPPIKEE